VADLSPVEKVVIAEIVAPAFTKRGKAFRHIGETSCMLRAIRFFPSTSAPLVGGGDLCGRTEWRGIQAAPAGG